MTRRFALYFCPAEASDLYHFGTWWLGRDCDSVDAAIPPDCGLATEDWRHITRSPRQYGFHATLKPPFALADGATRSDLVEALIAFAGERRAFQAPPLHLVQHEGFLALMPVQDSPALTAFADACVVELDRFRRPAGLAELQRRREAGLTPRQDELLTRWGYPYVFDEFRFHMTLTERLSEADYRQVHPLLASRTEAVAAAPLEVADLCLFEQADRDMPFVLTQRFPLATAVPTKI